MTEVVFYEKPGCLSNARQKALLQALGHRLTVRDLLAEPWTTERLRGFFGDRPVADWFNYTAPRVKSGEVMPAALDADEALALMVADPILVRRPLLELPGLKACGFESGPVLAALGVALGPGEDYQACSHPRASPGIEASCPEPDVQPAARGEA
jgi:nitrogenase-associated protein